MLDEENLWLCLVVDDTLIPQARHDDLRHLLLAGEEVKLSGVSLEVELEVRLLHITPRNCLDYSQLFLELLLGLDFTLSTCSRAFLCLQFVIYPTDKMLCLNTESGGDLLSNDSKVLVGSLCHVEGDHLPVEVFCVNLTTIFLL